jgi:hypothetical protein
VVNNPIRYSDPTGHCFFGLDTIICAVIIIAGIVGGVAAANHLTISTLEAGAPLQAPAALAQEQQSARQWDYYNSCARCHYVSNDPNPSSRFVNGPRPATPLGNMHFAGVTGIVTDSAAMIGSFTTIANTPKLLRRPTGVRALEELDAISEQGNGPDNRQVVPGEDAYDWFTRVINGEGNAKNYPNGGRYAPKLYGDVPEGGTAYYRPTTSSNPALEIRNVPGFPRYFKYHFPLKPQ